MCIYTDEICPSNFTTLIHSLLSYSFVRAFTTRKQLTMVMKTGYRNAAPAHYKVKIENFSLAKTKIDRYESEAFEAAGHKWKLVVYPNGHVRRGGQDHVSIYLAIAEKSTLPIGWQIQVIFKMFVFDFNKDQYYTAEDDDRVWRFQDQKSEWGFDKLLSVNDLDTSKGYLSEEDTCIFGVEVFELKYTGKGESLSVIENIDENLFQFSVPNLSGLDSKPRFLDEFVVGGQKWKLTLYPKGDAAARGRTLSLYLNLANRIILPAQRMFVHYKLRVKNNFPGLDDMEKEDSFWFSSASTSHGVSGLISLDDLNKPSKGFLWNDNLKVEVEVLTISQVTDFS